MSDAQEKPQDRQEGTHPASSRRTARRAWTVSGIIVAFCVVLATAAVWVFDVIDLPGLGRFGDRFGTASASSASSGARTDSAKAGGVAGLGKSLAKDGSWPASTGAKPADTKALSDATQDFLSHTGSPAKEGYVIANGDGTVVSSSNADTPLEPASTMKTLTALTATGVLDMDSTLDTDVLVLRGHAGRGHAGRGHTGRSSGRSGTATIVLLGGGDMLLGSGSSDPSHINGHAGLATLAGKTAAALSRRGIRSVRLLSDTTLFGAVHRPATMTEDYVKTGYFTPTSALAVDEGRQSVPGSDPDSSARSTVPRTDDPASAAVSAFSFALTSALASKGIRLTNVSSGGGISVPAVGAAERAQEGSGKSSERIARVSSAPLRRILGLTLRLSDNTLAEEFGRLAALRMKTGNSPAAAVKAVRKELARQGIDLSGAEIADCSGLSPGSRLTPRMLFRVMRRLRTHAEASAFRGLPVVTKTSSDYSADALGRVRLKSGSLNEVTSDSGVVLRTNGGFFYYAAIVNVPDGQWAARSEGLSALHRLAGRLVSM